jgi:hypothetical protein
MNNKSTLDFEDYLEAAGDAAKRTRTVILVLVVASVLTFVGLLNSLSDTWMAKRVQTLSKAGIALTKPPDALDEDDNKALGYLQEKIGLAPSKYREGKETDEYKEYKKHYDELYIGMVRAYVENTFTIRVPFFGIAFDINYLGLLGGLGFVIILVLFRFTITRELDNLKLSFEEAQARTQLWQFYHLLAMRQVLTTPPMKQKKRSKFMQFIPKMICFLPLIVHAIVTANDFSTSRIIGEKISEALTKGILYEDSFFLVSIIILTIACYRRWKRIDVVWNEYWIKAKEEVESKTMEISKTTALIHDS